MNSKKMNVFQNNDDAMTMLEGIFESLNNGANDSLPSPEMVSHYVLDSNRKMFLNYLVDIDAVEVTKRILRWNMDDANLPAESRKPIWLYIMNYGGSADYAWHLIDIILASKTPVYTVNVGVCGSAGALIYLAGHKRFMMPRATLLIHEGSISVSGDAQKFNDAADSYKKMLKAMREYILSRTKISPTVLARKKDNDWEIDAKYCIDHGACEHIVESLDDIL